MSGLVRWPVVRPPTGRGAPQIVTPEPVAEGGATAYTQDLAGTLTSAGALTEAVSAYRSGALTSAGALAELVSTFPAGTLTMSGSAAGILTRVLSVAGTLGLAGAVTAAVAIVRAGTLTSSGAKTNAAAAVRAGTLTTAGALTKAVSAIRAGVLGLAGAISNVETAGPVAYTLSLAGTLTFSARTCTHQIINALASAALTLSALASGALSFLSKVMHLEDDFEDGAAEPFWTANYTNSPVAVTEASGRLTFTLATSGANYSGYKTAASYDLTGNQCTAELVSASPQQARFETYMAIEADGSNAIFFQVVNDVLQVWKQTTADGFVMLDSEAYDDSAHRWLRIRESGGTTYWDKSADGFTWTNVHSVANPITVTSVAVEIGAGVNTTALASAATAVWDNLNVFPLSLSGLSVGSTSLTGLDAGSLTATGMTGTCEE